MTLNAKIHALLTDAILSGRLLPGQVILETHVANIVGSSRMPIKQALAQLSEDGLVSRFEGRGYVVGNDNAAVIRDPLTAQALGLAEDDAGTLKTRASESIYDSVERELIHCSIFGRFRINEQELAKHYGVSRTVAHDVLMLAQVNGIIVKDERSRWYVVPLDEYRVACLYELREQLEPLALSRAAKHVPQKLLKAMAGRLEKAIARYPKVPPALLDELEMDLHIHCMSYCPNPEFIEVLKRTRCILIFGKHMGHDIGLPVGEPFFAEHVRIIEAMAGRDAKAVARETLDHLHRSLPKVTERARRLRSTESPPDLPYVK